jgi:hypothetical protein
MTFPFLELPSELQGLIFELAVDVDPQNAANLSLVSRNAAQWQVLCSSDIPHTFLSSSNLTCA